MAWEEYTAPPITRTSKEPKITIRDGKFNFNSYVRKEFIKGIPYATLLYDATNEKIGIRLEKEKTNTSVTITRESTTNPNFLSAVPFFNHYKLDTSTTKSYTPTLEQNEEESIIVINLKEGQPVNYTPRTTSDKNDKKDEKDNKGQVTAQTAGKKQGEGKAQ